jgi:hypothetical protein
MYTDIKPCPHLQHDQNHSSLSLGADASPLFSLSFLCLWLCSYLWPDWEDIVDSFDSFDRVEECSRYMYVLINASKSTQLMMMVIEVREGEDDVDTRYC